MKKNILLVVIFAFYCQLHAQAPSNDECEGAIALTVNTNLLCGTTTAGTTAGGTPSAQDLGGVSGTPNNDVWYTFVATAAEHRISLTNIIDLVGGDDEDMGIAAYSGDCTTLSFLDTSDPESFSLAALTVGDTYYLRVYGWDDEASPMNFDICIGTMPPPPANDECEGAIPLTPGASSCLAPTAGTTAGGTPSAQDPDEVSGTPNNDVWYTFVATAAEHIISLANIVDLNGDDEDDMGIAVYSGDCSTLSFIDSSDPEIMYLTGLTLGDTYYVRVYGWDDEAIPMTFGICIRTIPPPPANDECEGAIPLTPGASSCLAPTAGTTAGGTPSAQNPDDVSGTPNNDVWYTFAAAAAEHIISLGNVADLNGDDEDDMGIAVYSGDCTALSFIDSSDPETMYLTGLTVGDTYYVRVYGWDSDAIPMNFEICIATQASLPDNDACSSATVITIPYTNSQDASGATNNSGFVNDCDGNQMNDGVWYAFTGNGSAINISVDPFGWDPKIGVYKGTCGGMQCVGSVDEEAAGGEETYLISNSEPGVTYYVNVGYYDSSDELEGLFRMSILLSLGVPDFDAGNFKAYPNPVNGILNLSYDQAISDVQVFNLLGQNVASKAINNNEGQIDMSGLPSGSYLVRVTTEGETKTIKVVKQ